MALTHERHFARRFCRYSGNIAMRYFLHNQKVVRETLCVSSALLFFAGIISPRQKWTKVRITKSEISMRTWRSPMNAASQGAFVVIPEISLCDISGITIQVHPTLGACFGTHAGFLYPQRLQHLRHARKVSCILQYAPCLACIVIRPALPLL